MEYDPPGGTINDIGIYAFATPIVVAPIPLTKYPE
jgi:hypothetical protein